MFNEEEWIKLIFLLADTQSWLDHMHNNAFCQLPIPAKKMFQRKTYWLTAAAVAHILEKHYHKINRHPHAGKFTIPVTEILEYIRQAECIPPQPIAGNINFSRLVQLKTQIGFNKDGQYVDHFTIISGPAGNIITAFPGK